MRSHGGRLAVLGVAVAAVVAGCAGIPTSGPVHEAGQLNGVGDEPFSRIVAQGPAEGATPNAILTGFLAASASFDDDHLVARSFLTPDAARAWRPVSKVQVYQQVTGPPGPFVSLGKDTYHFSAPLAGTLDVQGAYTGARDGVSVSEDFTLQQVGGQWRIAKLPQGLLLTTNDLSRAYRAYDIYFPDPGRTVLVPDEVLVPVGPGLSTSLVRAVLQGPTQWLAKAVRTAVPTGTRLVVDSVPVTDGVAQVDLTGPAATVSRGEAQAMSAQLVWTLRQLGGITAVRITVDSVPLQVPGTGDIQNINAWSGFNPDGGLSDAKAYVVVNGRAATVGGDAGQLEPVRGPLGDGSTAVSLVVPSYDGTELAALDPTRHRLLVAGMTSSSKVVVAASGTSLTAPSWDRTGDVFVADTTRGSSTVWMVPAGSTGAKRVAVDASLPAGSTVAALRLSRDGTRVAVLADSAGTGQVYLGLVLRSGDAIALTTFRAMTTGVDTTVSAGSVADVAWASADRLLVLSRAATDTPQAWLVDLAGSVEQGYGAVPDGSMVAVTAAPDHAILSSLGDGSLWRYNNGIGSWSAIGKGAYPAYPG